MPSPTDQAEASIPTETVRESSNQNLTLTVCRKAAKRSESWYQTTSEPLLTPARKKPRLEEPLPTTADEVDRETPAPDVPAGIPPPDATNDANANADLVTDTKPNPGAAWVWSLDTQKKCKLTNAALKPRRGDAGVQTRWVCRLVRVE
jgi:hypothetical protein